MIKKSIKNKYNKLNAMFSGSLKAYRLLAMKKRTVVLITVLLWNLCKIRFFITHYIPDSQADENHRRDNRQDPKDSVRGLCSIWYVRRDPVSCSTDQRKAEHEQDDAAEHFYRHGLGLHGSSSFTVQPERRQRRSFLPRFRLSRSIAVSYIIRYP